MATTAEQRAYARGYSAAAKWPDYRPPLPPDDVARMLVTALQELRDMVDGELAKFLPDDEMVVKLYPYVDQATEALEALGCWIKTGHVDE